MPHPEPVSSNAASLQVAPVTARRVSGWAPVTARRVRGWGGGEGADVRMLRIGGVEQLAAALERVRGRGHLDRGAIARGMGRGYGDAAQLDGGLVLDTTRWTGFELDPERGTVTAEAGVPLGALLDALVPQGWIVPVLPGTQHVSVGGAVASDIHGKNHGTAGTFGSHVEALGLLTAAGETLELSEGDPRLAATIGGMGLTGVIVWARIRLRAVSSPLLAVDTDRADSLEGVLAALRAPGGAHRVAWLDLLGTAPVRGVVTRADHLDAGDVPSGARGTATVTARATVPAGWPSGLLRPAAVRAFNEVRFRRSPRRERGRVESLGAHMFPLDALVAWPRLYGSQGLVQYQLVVPFGAEQVLETVIERLRRSAVPCYLAVLKDFGEANEAPLSFPIAGWTLALDLPRAAPGLERLLEGFDELVAEVGGRVYLSKDSRMRRDAVRAMYPRLDEWRQVRDGVDPEGVWRSDLAERTGLVQERARTTSETTTTPAPVRTVASSAPKRLLLLGGTSEIGLAIARRLAREGPVRPYLIGRDRDRLSAALADLERSGCSEGELAVLDADDLDSHPEAVARAFELMDGIDLVVLAVGVLGAQAGVEADRAEALEVMRVNFTGAGSLLLEAMRRLEDQGAGTCVVLSSVAAERPRATNAVYGAAKAGLDALAQGLADASAGSGVRVLVVRPGFVRTKMTEGLPEAPMATTAAEVAEATVRALDGDAHTIWVPGRLRLVFTVLRHLPRPIFRRLPL
jgi:decaprenylphospho-beta-D-ribofuranose 2-oxidase